MFQLLQSAAISAMTGVRAEKGKNCIGKPRVIKVIPPVTPPSRKQAELASPKGVIIQANESPNRGARTNQSLARS